MRSTLPADTLSNIWILSDTTKSGKLFFPEFALAMYLCSLVIKGSSLPSVLPEHIKNEVSSFVDIISFNTPDAKPPPPPANVPSFATGASSVSTQPAPSAQPTQPESNLNSLISLQQTAMANQALQAQRTGGFIAPQGTGYTPAVQAQVTGYQPALQAQTTGYTPTLQAQTTGYTPALQAQTTGYTPTIQAQTTGYQPALQAQTTGYTPTVQAQTTGYQSTLQAQTTGYQAPLQAQSTGYQVAPLTAMPTGRPGEWGFINTPTGGLPGMDVFKSRFMPQQGVQNFTSSELQGNAKVEWAITKEEKRIYDGIFSEWDKDRKGFISGEMGINIFSQSGLNRQDLETIWTLADPGNKGKLDRDEFSVAMHLIYRHLNGYPIPSRLPPELIPPSSQNFSDSVDQIKSYLKASSKPSSGTVSYLKNHSLKSSTPAFKKDATVFKNNDDDFGYVSKSRHRSKKDPSDFSDKNENQLNPDDMSIAQLRKLVHEKQILLDAIDAKDEEDYDAVQDIEYRDLKIIDELKSRITNIQKEINQHPDAPLLGSDPQEKKKSLMRQLNKDADALPQITNDVRKVEDDIVRLKLELFRLQAEKQHPGSTIVGTGPNGTITEADRRKAKTRARLKSRMAAITGNATEGSNDFEEFEAKFFQESEAIRKEREDHERLFTDVEDSAQQIKRDLELSLRDTRDDIHSDRERLRWEEAIGVEDEVKDLIYSLRHMNNNGVSLSSSSSLSSPTPTTSTSATRSFGGASDPASSASSTTNNTSISSSSASGPASSKRSASERAAYIKAEAERRMNEKMAALGITRPNKSSSAFQAPGTSSPPSSSPTPVEHKAPPPPPPPHHKPSLTTAPHTPTVPAVPAHTPAVPAAPVSIPVAPPVPAPAPAPIPAPVAAPVPAYPEPIRAPEPTPVSIRAPPPPSAPPVSAAADDDSSSSDDDWDDDEYKELQRLKAEEEARLRKLEEERKSKDAKKALKAQKKAERLASLKAEMEAMKERERRLMADGSDSEDEKHNKHASASQPVIPPTTAALSPSTIASTNSSTTPDTSTSSLVDSSSDLHKTNPFYRGPGAPTPAAAAPAVASAPAPAPAPAAPPAHHDNNPFFKPTAAAPAAPAAPVAPPPVRSTTPRASDPGIDAAAAASQRASQRGQSAYDDGWGADSPETSDDEAESQSRGAPDPSKLASMLFRSMAPQRPIAAQPTTTSTPVPAPAPAEPVVPFAPVSSAPAPPVAPAAPPVPFAPVAAQPIPSTQLGTSSPDSASTYATPESSNTPDLGPVSYDPSSFAAQSQPQVAPPAIPSGAPPPPPVPNLGSVQIAPPPPPPIPNLGNGQIAPPSQPVAAAPPPPTGAAPPAPPPPNFSAPPPPPPAPSALTNGGGAPPPPPPPPPPPGLLEADVDDKPDFAGSGLLAEIQSRPTLRKVVPPR